MAPIYLSRAIAHGIELALRDEPIYLDREPNTPVDPKMMTGAVTLTLLYIGVSVCILYAAIAILKYCSDTSVEIAHEIRFPRSGPNAVLPPMAGEEYSVHGQYTEDIELVELARNTNEPGPHNNKAQKVLGLEAPPAVFHRRGRERISVFCIDDWIAETQPEEFV